MFVTPFGNLIFLPSWRKKESSPYSDTLSLIIPQRSVGFWKGKGTDHKFSLYWLSWMHTVCLKPSGNSHCILSLVCYTHRIISFIQIIVLFCCLLQNCMILKWFIMGYLDLFLTCLNISSALRILNQAVARLTVICKTFENNFFTL